MTNKRLYVTGAALLLALALGACGGSNNDDNNGGQNANAGASDAFFAQVAALVANSPDTTEPVEIDGIAATSPETIEPAAL